MLILFLDDSEDRISCFQKNAIGHTVHIAKNADEAIELLGKNVYDVVYLDHDLSILHYDGIYDGKEKTGYDVALALSKMNHLFGCRVFVHTLNYDGRRKMKAALQNNFKVTVPEDVNESFLWKMDVANLVKIVSHKA